VNNSKSTTFDDVPIVSCIVYHPFDHIVAFSGIGKHPDNGMPLPICLYKFDKSNKGLEESESNNTTSSVDITNSLKTPSFFDTKNQYNGKLSPLPSNTLPLREIDATANGNTRKNEDKKKSKSTSQSPEKLKSMLYELDQFLLEKEQN
jgi:hypothetical protein